MNKCCELNFTIEEQSLDFNIQEQDLNFQLDSQYVIGGGTSDYNKLSNKPQINSITLIGNKTSQDLGLEPTIIDITEQDIDDLIFGG